MRKTLLAFLTVMLYAAPLQAQYQPPSEALSPYEQQRYGSKLWQVPRDPYQSQYRSAEYQARPYIPPQEESASPSISFRKRGRGGGGPVTTAPPRQVRQPTRAQQRFQNRKQFEINQRAISERSRVKVPGPIKMSPGPGSSKATPGKKLSKKAAWWAQASAEAQRQYQSRGQAAKRPPESGGSRRAWDGSWNESVAPWQARESARSGERFQGRKQLAEAPERLQVKAAGRLSLTRPPRESINQQRQYFLVSAFNNGMSHENSRRAQFKKLPR